MYLAVCRRFCGGSDVEGPSLNEIACAVPALPAFRLIDLCMQDMNLASQAAVATDSPMPLGEAAKFLYEEVVKHDGGRLARKDFSVVYKFLREVNAEAAVEEDVDDVQ